jgi:cystathionine beta-lyase
VSEQRPNTRLIASGRGFDTPVAIANVAVHRASTVLMSTLEEARVVGEAAVRGDRHATSYGTAGTPTTLALMDALAEVEAPGHDCRAALMPSGLSAITTLLLAFVGPRDHLLMPDSVYGPTRVFCDGLLAHQGVEVEYYDPAIGTAIEGLIRPSTRMLYLESPGSYTFEIQDVPAICAIARRRGVLTAIDNAWASPVFSRPFDWGVDASVLPLTKYWSGHSDLLMGAAVVREPLWAKLWSTPSWFCAACAPPMYGCAVITRTVSRSRAGSSRAPRWLGYCIPGWLRTPTMGYGSATSRARVGFSLSSSVMRPRAVWALASMWQRRHFAKAAATSGSAIPGAASRA